MSRVPQPPWNSAIRASVALMWLLFCLSVPLFPEETHDSCGICHTETLKDFLAHPHSKKQVSCDACHGESLRHRTSQGHAEPDRVAAPDEIPSLCGSCHPGKEATSILDQFSESKHGKLVLQKSKTRAPHCGTCHGVHLLLRGGSIEAQCKRCHTQLPSTCLSPQSNRSTVSCVTCHAPHTLATKTP